MLPVDWPTDAKALKSDTKGASSTKEKADGDRKRTKGAAEEKHDGVTRNESAE